MPVPGWVPVDLHRSVNAGGGMFYSVRRFFAYAGLASLPSLLAAQQPVTISGAVASDAGLPLGQAEVSIPTLGVGAFTKDDGRYTIVIPGARVSGQAVAVTARRLRDKPMTLQITLTPGGVTHDFTLAANPMQLGEVVVTGAGTVSAAAKLGSVRHSVDSPLTQRNNGMYIGADQVRRRCTGQAAARYVQ